MSTKFYTLLTEIGAAKLANATILGTNLKITQMAVGDGGGTLPTPNSQQTQLIGEKRRAGLNQLYIDPQNSSQIIAEQIIPENEGGWWIREVGLFDEDGELIAVGNCAESYKPLLAEGSGRTQTVRMILITRSTDNITLKIDPSIVLATRKYVDDKIIELIADVDGEYARMKSPELTGIPKAPTAEAGNNTQQIATTEFVQSAIAARITSFAKLRQTTPTHEGQRVLLASWNEDTKPYGQSSFGGGEFIAVSGNESDDGGFIAKVSDSWYWKRIKDANLATVLDFGAVPDGVSDCHDAIVNMHNWAQSKTTRFYRAIPAVQFPEGEFYSTPVDFTSQEYHHFILKGPHVAFGYHAQTTITSNKSSNAMFKTNARTIEISGLIVEGQNDTNANSQPFLDNTTGSITGGVFFRMQSMWYQNLGGLAIKLNDTLDTKCDQFYAKLCVGGILHVGYDNETVGNWNHPTAVELTNFNIQDCTDVAVFSMPRCLQSLIRNGWIERSYGGNFTDGHWLVESLSVESCANYGPTDFTNSQAVFVQVNQVASIINRGYDQSSAWQTSFRPGQTELNNDGMMTLGSQSYGWLTTPTFIRNNTPNDYWYKIGKLWLNDAGDTFEIDCLGEQGYNDATTESNQTLQSGRGRTIITLRKQSNYKIRGQYHCEGLGAVQDVAIVGGQNVSTDVYIFVKAYSKVGIYCRSNVAGTNEMTMLNGNRTNTTLNWQPIYKFTDGQLSSPPSGYEKIKARYSVNLFSADNSIYGALGISSDGFQEERTKGPTGYTVGTAIVGYLPRHVNGTLVAIPYYSMTKNS